jgi:hypothetical protein
MLPYLLILAAHYIRGYRPLPADWRLTDLA